MGQFDVVAANILAGPIVDLASTLCSVLRGAGDMVLSGILDQQAQQVMDAFPQVTFRPVISEEEWICLTGQLRG